MNIRAIRGFRGVLEGFGRRSCLGRKGLARAKGLEEGKWNSGQVMELAGCGLADWTSQLQTYSQRYSPLIRIPSSGLFAVPTP